MATWYVDPIAGSDSNAGTSVGAPLATIGAVWAKGFAANEDIYLKGTANELVTLGVAGTGNLYCEIIGYTTTPGDGGMAYIDAQNTRQWCIDVNSKANWRLQNIELKNPTTALYRNTGTCTMVTHNCRHTKGTSSCPLFSNNGGVFSGMTITATDTTFTSIAAGGAGVIPNLRRCTLTTCGNWALQGFNSNGMSYIDCIFRDYANVAISGGASSSNITIENNTFYNFTSAGCISLDSAALSNVVVRNNIFSNIGGTAVTLSATASDTLVANYNSFYSCTTRYGNSRADGANDTTLGTSPFSSTTTLELSALNQGQKTNVSRGAVQYAGGGGGGMPMIGSRIGGGLSL